jgi:glycosyltransferase involved in cell wall biosynthesis
MNPASKNITFFYPSNKRSVQIETTLIELKNLGHNVFLLTTCERGRLHNRIEELAGIKIGTNISTYKNSALYYVHHIYLLTKHCKQNQTDLVFGNLQQTNFISVLAQFFIKAKVINFRHHFKFSKGNFGIKLNINRNELMFDKVINLLSKKIVVPSMGVYNGMEQHEKVKISKVSIIPYLYHFSQYKQPILQHVNNIKELYPAKLHVIMVARLIPFKRHLQILPIYKKMIAAGYDIQIFILDEGSEKDKIRKYIDDHHLQKRIHLVGFTTKFLDYMMASDILIHPSLTEASNNVVKEMGLMKKAVAVCKGVGDFDEYIINEKNGFLMNIEDPEKDVEVILNSLYINKNKSITIGEELYKTIQTKFGNSTEQVIKLYRDLINSYE